MSDVIMVLFEETFLHDFPNSQKIFGDMYPLCYMYCGFCSSFRSSVVQ